MTGGVVNVIVMAAAEGVIVSWDQSLFADCMGWNCEVVDQISRIPYSVWAMLRGSAQILVGFLYPAFRKLKGDFLANLSSEMLKRDIPP